MWLRPQPIGTLALMGLTGVTLSYVAFNRSLAYTTASDGALIQDSSGPSAVRCVVVAMRVGCRSAAAGGGPVAGWEEMPVGRLVAIAVVLFSLVLVGPAAALAQEPRAGGGADQFPITPDPTGCQVTPRLTDELLALWFAVEGSPITTEASPMAEGGTTEASPVAAPVDVDEEADVGAVAVPVATEASGEAGGALTEMTIPVGSPADEETVAAIVTTVSEIFSCFAAGDFPRATALFTDDLVRSFGPEPGQTPEDVRVFLEATPEAGAEGEVGEIVAITDVMLLADGRVGAFVVDRSEGTLSTVYAIFEQQGDRWLADEVIEFTGGGEEGESTPTP
ncbi:MAG: hypothetical protein M3Q03_16685 [Chloroflexota bacterium]|nr:hypothetical protein [Chloroflexota bacterium]